MKIEQLPLDKLIPYARNSRTHSDAQVAQIAASIKEFGFTNPVLIDKEDGIIAGHGRVLAARKLNLEQVPCIRLGHLTETQKRAYVIADNKLALNAGWDDELLGIEINELLQENFDISEVGFNEDEIAVFLDGTQNAASLGLTPEEKLNNFLNGDTKILRLAYNDEDFEVIVRKLEDLKDKTNAEDFSQIVFELVNHAKN